MLLKFRWRSFESEKKAMEMEGFIDGDFVERFLELPESIQLQVIAGNKAGSKKLSSSLHEITDILEQLGRLH